MFAYVGCHTKPSLGGVFNGVGEGVYAFAVDPADGSMTKIDVGAAPDPTFLAISPATRTLYAGSHSVVFEGGPGAGVTAFRIGADGRLNRLNAQRIAHPHVTTVALDRTGRFLLVASSLGGAVSALPIAADGRLGAVSDAAQFEGQAVIAVGETPEPTPVPGVPGMTITRMPKYGPEITMPHCANAALRGDWVLSADIGPSAIGVLGFDRSKGVFTSTRRFPIRAGAGPRILALHPNGTAFYSVNELDSTVSAFALDPADGSVREAQHLSSLPAGVSVRNTASGIAIRPDGRFLWTSNRGHNSISTFAIDPDGRLEFVACVPSGGEFPIHLGLTPDARLLFASNTLSRTLAAFEPDRRTGVPQARAVTATPATCSVFLA